MSSQPRMRVFAGPNGSGKSTLKPYLLDYQLGVYVNADEIAKHFSANDSLDLRPFGVSVDEEPFRQHMQSELTARNQASDFSISDIGINGSFLSLGRYRVNSYSHAIVADYIRRQLLSCGATFCYETVLSHPSKVSFMREALSLGYRTYLYYIATEDPDINVNRVRNRVLLGGHNVPEEKIRSRYVKSLDLLFDAINASSRAFIFDNSGSAGQHFMVASYDGSQLTIESPQLPAWFDQYVMARLV